MRLYDVVVKEDTHLSWIFQGVEAEHKNAACASAIRQYVELLNGETEIKNLCAVASIAK